MNPLTNMRNLTSMNESELASNVAGTSRSWHNEYKDSAWVYIGGLPYELSEGDVIAVFSQYGEVVHVNLVRDLSSGKSRGFAFLCYEDQRSTILAVDNLNGVKVCQRYVRVDHVHTYKLPKNLEKMDEERRKLFINGCAPTTVEQPHELDGEQHRPSKEPISDHERARKRKDTHHTRRRSIKKDKKKRKKEKRRRRDSTSSSSSSCRDNGRRK